MPTPKLILIAAASRNGVLASKGRIPWHLPRDVAHFRARTAGRWLLLGRTTYEQMTGWFQPGQVPVVLTRRADYEVPRGWAVPSVQEALGLATAHGAEELVVCGGGSVYEATLPWADQVILTTVEMDVVGDAWFPTLREDEWQVVAEEHFPVDEGHEWPMTISQYRRIGPRLPDGDGRR